MSPNTLNNNIYNYRLVRIILTMILNKNSWSTLYWSVNSNNSIIIFRNNNNNIIIIIIFRNNNNNIIIIIIFNNNNNNIIIIIIFRNNNNIIIIVIFNNNNNNWIWDGRIIITMIMFIIIGCSFKFRLHLLNRGLEIVDNSNNSTNTIITHKYNKTNNPTFSIAINTNP